MSKLPDDLEIIAVESLERVAKLIGPKSAAAAALKNYESLAASGANPAIGYSAKHSCYVVADIGNEELQEP